MTNEIDRIESAIRHIRTSVDIDPWAMEIAVKAMTKQMEDLKNSPTQMSGTSDLISRQAAIDLFPNDDLEWDTKGGYIAPHLARRMIEELPSAEPEQCEYAVNALAVEEMLKDLLPESGMWEIKGDEAKTAICEVVRSALEGLWKLPFVKPDSKESSLTQKALDNNMPSAQPDWNEMLVICDNCGHAITVKRGVE